MSRLDSPGHVALLFAGAALVSLLLVALLTAEARTRKALRADPVIENSNLFSSFGRRVASLFSQRENKEEEKEKKIVPGDEDSEPVRRTRDLKSIVVTRQDNDTWWTRGVSTSHHRHRHNGERRSHQHHKNNSNSENNNSNSNSSSLNNNNNSETCYGPNEVLLIIAVTCAVNFAFIFGVMTIVHLCNVRNNRQYSNESLTSVVTLGSCEIEKPRHGSCCHDTTSLPGSSTLLLLPELEETRSWHSVARRLSQYQPLLAHSMEDLHILE